ncbi:MAG: hypothetical protein ACREBH_01745 [Candidatus Micrarchaeaceae archaeon]
MAASAKTIDSGKSRNVIQYTGKDLDYLGARELVRGMGGLPSNVLHDDVMVMSDAWKNLLMQNYYGAWAREILVYPKGNEKFKKGVDATDSYKDAEGRTWTLPASYIPEAAIERAGVGLFIDPQNIVVNGKAVVIIPEYTKILSPFIKDNGRIGCVDWETRIPTFVGPDEKYTLLKIQKRYLWREYGAGIRPISRGILGMEYDGRDINARTSPDETLGVGFVLNLDTSGAPNVSELLRKDAGASIMSKA